MAIFIWYKIITPFTTKPSSSTSADRSEYWWDLLCTRTARDLEGENMQPEYLAYSRSYGGVFSSCDDIYPYSISTNRYGSQVVNASRKSVMFVYQHQQILRATIKFEVMEQLRSVFIINMMEIMLIINTLKKVPLEMSD